MGLKVDGLDVVIADLKELEYIPDGVYDDMLLAGAEVIKAAQEKQLRSEGLVATGTLLRGVTIFRKISREKGGARFMRIYPYGDHHTYASRKVSKKRGKNRRKNVSGTKTVTVNDVAFVHEFGAPGRGIPARQWMRKASESAADEAVAAADKVYEAYLKEEGF